MTTATAPDFRELARLLIEAARVESESSRPDQLGKNVLLDDPKLSVRRLEDLPKEVGVLLASVGVLGFVLPGIAGTPALIAGGLVLWPKTFGKVEGWFSHRFPKAHRASLFQMGRFLDDLDRRYPQPPPDLPRNRESNGQLPA
jgi:hypothetical protein